MSANRDPHLRSTHGGTGKSDVRRLRFQRAAEGRGGVGGNHLATTAGKSAVSHFQLTLTLSVFLSVPASLFLCPKSAVHFPLSSPRRTATTLCYWLLYLLLLLYYPTERTIKSGAKLLSKTQLYRAGN